MTAYELFRESRLDEAIAAALQRVKAAPTDISGRLLLCDLLCFDNQLERADHQLDVIVQQDSSFSAGIALYRQLIRAEIARREVFESGRVPEFLNGATDVLKLHVHAFLALREGKVSEAGQLLRQAEEVRPPVRGECDGEPFTDLRDVDDLTAPFLEALTSSGKYYWIGWERIEKLQFKAPAQPRDLLWRQAEVVFRGGPDAVLHVPVLYAGSHRSQDSELRVGRRTDWREAPSGPTAGVGQRTLLVGEGDKSLLSIGTIAFSSAPAPSAA